MLDDKKTLDDYQGIVRMLIRLHTDETVSKKMRLMSLSNEDKPSKGTRAFVAETQFDRRQPKSGAGMADQANA